MPELEKGGDLAAFLATPLEPGRIRTLYCTACGSITYIQTSAEAGVGDPEAHNRYHERRGES